MRARMLAAFFLIILIHNLLLVLTLILGYGNSKEYWNDHVEQESHAFVMEFLTEMMNQGGTLNAASSSLVLESARNYLIESAQVFLYSPEGELLESWTNPLLDNYSLVKSEVQKAEALYYNGQLRGYVQIIPLSFSYVNHNNVFIARIIKLFTLGLILSAGLSLLLAFRISASFTREARRTARSLIKLAGGSRVEEFTKTATAELSTINEAAGSLQKMLISEEDRRILRSRSLAHDLKTPLTALKTQLYAYRDGVLLMTPEGWEKIMSEIAVLESLTKDFLILGELDTEGNQLSIKKGSAESLRAGIMDSLADLAESKGISLEWSNGLDYLYCDFPLTSRALEALVKNAIQHMTIQGIVEIEAGGTAESPHFRVINPGTIEEEHLSLLFDPLYKTDRSRNKRGSGLGLTISRRIAEFHNGSLRVENLDEHRVCFTLSLNRG
jgi:two-component system sensor histidine kinase BaeS